MAPQLPFRAPTEVPLLDEHKQLTFGWVQHFQFTAQQLKTPANQPPPLSAGQAGQHGQISVNGGFLYVYDGTVARWIKFAPVAF